MKRTVRVTITKEIEIELTPAVFGPMSQAEYLESFRRDLWPIEGIDDVFKYAAAMAATCGSGYTHDGLGLVSDQYSRYPREPDVKFRELFEEIEEEFVDGVPSDEGAS